jgi:acyl carrier protein
MKKFTREEIEKKVNEILVDELGIDKSEIRSEANLENDLGADSIDAVELTMEFEKEFYIDFSDEEMYASVQYTVGDIYDLVERKCKQS